jgi:hypothetical protein
MKKLKYFISSTSAKLCSKNLAKKNGDKLLTIRARLFLKSEFYRLDCGKSNVENVMILSLIMVEQIAFKYLAKMVDAPDNSSNKKKSALRFDLDQIAK